MAKQCTINVLLLFLLIMFFSISCNSAPAAPVTTPKPIPSSTASAPAKPPTPPLKPTLQTPTPATKTSTVAPQLPDLVADSVTYANRNIVVTFHNGGTAAALNVPFEVNYFYYKSSSRSESGVLTPNPSSKVTIPLSNGTVSSVPAGGKVEKTFPIDSLNTILREKYSLNPGERSVELIVDAANSINELKEDNNTKEGSVVFANAPFPRREPQSALETAINKSFDSFTVYTAANQQEVVDMAVQGPLRPFIAAGLDMSKLKITFLEYDDFTKKLEEVLVGEKAPSGLRSAGLITGTNVFIRNGIIPSSLAYGYEGSFRSVLYAEKFIWR